MIEFEKRDFRVAIMNMRYTDAFAWSNAHIDFSPNLGFSSGLRHSEGIFTVAPNAHCP